MPTLIITVDPDCCRCSSKIQKVLCCLQESGEFAIDKVVYEKDKVIVSGAFDADKLSCKLCCKAGKIIKSIEEPPPPPPPRTEPKCKPSPPCNCNCPPPYCECPTKPACNPKPEQCKPYPCQCACPPRYCHCPPPPKPKPDPKPDSKPKPEPCKVLPYPFPYPYPPPAWGCGCPPPYCQCPKKPKPPSPPPPQTARPCQCPTWPSCYHYWGYPPPMPYPPMVVCDDNQPYGACAIM